MSIRQSIRDYLDASDGPKWCSEIMAAVVAAGFKCKPSVISGMVNDGSLIAHTDVHPHSYSVGIRPVVRVVLTPEERIARRRACDRERDKIRKPRRGQAQTDPKARRAQAPVRIVPVGGQTVEEFMARGGQVERLPGFQRDGVYPQRRPIMNNYRSMA